MAASASERNRAARELFAPLAGTYDRYARLLSFGQDPRWRSFLASRLAVGPGDTVLDVASGTGAVAVEVARRHGCRVVGVDQSPEMLAEGRRRVDAAGLGDRVELREARAEELPFEDGAFEGLTFTYLLRYVDDPEATLRELARVLRPGGSLSCVEFHEPEPPLLRAGWWTYTRSVMPLVGAVVSPAWRHTGRFLGPSISAFYARAPLPEQIRWWQAAGLRHVRSRVYSLGVGIVIRGVKPGRLGDG
jgi:demethylmenaquinone methyltransferase / 2-methoxy-6-polyprenyl-1,4-benzoquinol methylase